MRNLSKIVLSVAAVALGFACPPGAHARTLYESAMDKYRGHLYQQAANDFYSLAGQEPSKQLYHYLLANCLVHLDEHKRAAEEYQVGYMLDPSSSTGQMCKKALIGYKKQLPPSAAESPDARIEDTELSKTKALIRKQADREKDKQDLMTARSEKSVQARVDDELRRIDQWMHYEIQRLSDPIVFDPAPRVNPLLSHPELMKEREDEIRATAKVERERAIKGLSEQNAGYETHRKEHDALLDEAAGNLQTQLDSPVGRSGVKLQAHGTGLYVRYYGKGGKNLLPDPQQATVRIEDASNSVPEAKTEGIPKRDPDKEVNGKVIYEVPKLPILPNPS